MPREVSQDGIGRELSVSFVVRINCNLGVWLMMARKDVVHVLSVAKRSRWLLRIGVRNLLFLVWLLVWGRTEVLVEQPTCPRCSSSENVVSRGGGSRERRNKQYFCKKCMRYFRFPRLRRENKSIDGVVCPECCPECSSKNIKKSGWGRDGFRRRYTCKDCGRTFVFPRLDEYSAIDSVGVASKVNPSCIECGSVHVIRNGFWDKERTRREFHCKACNANFVEGSISRVVSEKFKASVSAGSISELPCFCCPLNDDKCNADDCLLLEKWLRDEIMVESVVKEVCC